MTPKEKAEELYERYRKLTKHIPVINVTEHCKQCALICVDEILSMKMVYHMGGGEIGDEYNEGDFYEEVKKQIQIL